MMVINKSSPFTILVRNVRFTANSTGLLRNTPVNYKQKTPRQNAGFTLTAYKEYLKRSLFGK